MRSILNSNDNSITELNSVWAIKPNCSFIKLESRTGEGNSYNYHILNDEQMEFDFFEVIFNKQENRKFLFDSFTSQGKNITRELDKAILYNNEGIPYLAPEVKLFMISHPAYLASGYHKAKNQIDFDSTASVLPMESRNWLINALKTAYPDGHKRLEQLVTLCN